jgi:histidinol-phosphate/aromatic aminotransferase/cobyric acid decarboxylase-like protein
MFVIALSLLNPGDEIMVPCPGYNPYHQAAELAEATLVNINTSMATNFTLTAEMVRAHVTPKSKMLVLINPNNPTGTVVDAAKYKSFCEEMSKKTLVYLDEAYLEFLERAQQNSMVELVKQGHNVVVSRTFSKIYGLAGLRIGYLVGKPELIQKMQKYQTGTIISQPALAAAKASLGDDEFMAYTRKMNAAARQHLLRPARCGRGFPHGGRGRRCTSEGLMFLNHLRLQPFYYIGM